MPPPPEFSSREKPSVSDSTPESAEWIKQELAGCSFPDRRLHERLQQLLEQFSSGLGESIPFACQDWAHTKAAYRFLANPRVSEEAILAGHFQATQNRFAAASTAPILILHDTTGLTFARKERSLLGITHKSYMRKSKKGRPPSFGHLRHPDALQFGGHTRGAAARLSGHQVLEPEQV